MGYLVPEKSIFETFKEKESFFENFEMIDLNSPDRISSPHNIQRMVP